MSARRWGWSVVVLCACTTVESDDDVGESSTTSDPAAIECVAPATTDLVLTLAPGPGEFANSMESMTECSVTEVIAEEPASLSMVCGDGPDELEWRMDVVGLRVDLSTLFSVGQSIDLHYYTTQPMAPGLTQWAVFRIAGEDEPLLVVASASGNPFPHGVAPLAIDRVIVTTCDKSPGSCGVGSMWRGGVEFSIGPGESTIVFDHNEGEIGAYRVQVGDALHDEGNCEESSQDKYEFVLWPGNADG